MNNKNEEFDTLYQDEIVCPHCGYEHSDSWEVKHNDGEYNCDSCGKKFHYERHIEVTYSTRKH
jgi:transcription elongation factor Elf1